MAVMNTIRGEIIGKFGQVYGQHADGKCVERAIPFSHRPFNDEQKAAFAAFGCLQRFASQMYKGFWQYLGLRHENMTKANAVTKWLKPLVSGHAFDIRKIAEVIPPTRELNILSFRYIDERTSFAVEYEHERRKMTEKNVLCFSVYAENGQGYGYAVSEEERGTIYIPTENYVGGEALLVAFSTWTYAGKRRRTAVKVMELDN